LTCSSQIELIPLVDCDVQSPATSKQLKREAKKQVWYT
jgi:hypothetical protein